MLFGHLNIHFPSSPPQLPLTMPSLDFALTWHTNPRKSPVVSFWRPLPPAGALGKGVLRMCLWVSTHLSSKAVATQQRSSKATSAAAAAMAAATLPRSGCVLN